MKYTIAKLLLICSLLAGLFIPMFEAMAADGPRVQVLGLFRDKAIVKINGAQMLLKAGDAASNGVRLIRSNAKLAVIEINGVEKKFGLGSQVSTRLSSPKSSVVRIPSRRGMYKTSGLINGRSVEFLVDTGASIIAMSRPTADRLQIRYLEKGKLSRVSTAAAMKKAWHVKLDSVAVGGITLHQVDATVIDTLHEQEILLGMSFLGRVKFTQDQGVVVLEAKTR